MKQLSDLTQQERMVREQLMERGIRDERVLEAMLRVPREQFFPQEIREEAFADRAAPIGHGQTISQPYMVALMTQHLEVAADHKVMEIGTGSGYQAAILGVMAGHVYTMERIKPLLDEAFERLMALGIRNVHFRFGDGCRGWAEAGPFDRVLITAGARELPRELLLAQLKDGGVAVLPMGAENEQMLVAVKRQGEQLHVRDICACRFVKLIGEAGWEE